MTKAEQTNERNLDFSRWCRKNLKDSKLGLVLCDVDFVFYDYKTNKMMLIETKIFGDDLVDYASRQIFQILNKALKNYKENDFQYLGYHLLSFSCTDPDNSIEIKLDHNKISKKDLIDFLNLC